MTSEPRLVRSSAIASDTQRGLPKRGECKELPFYLQANSFPFSSAGLDVVLETSVPEGSGPTLPGLITQQSNVSGRTSLLGKSGQAGRRKQQETSEVTQQAPSQMQGKQHKLLLQCRRAACLGWRQAAAAGRRRSGPSDPRAGACEVERCAGAHSPIQLRNGCQHGGHKDSPVCHQAGQSDGTPAGPASG